MVKLTVGLRLNEIAAAGRKLPDNTCFTTVLQDGDWYGSDEPATNINPPNAADGTLYYSYRANAVTGEFRLRFGDAGDEELTNVLVIIYSHDNREVGLQWDSVNKYYTGDDLIAAQRIAALAGLKHCFVNLVVPDLLQFFDFSEIGVET